MTTIKKCTNRKICTLSEDYPFKTSRYRATTIGKIGDFSKIIKYIDENVVGRNVTFLGPFGRRKVVYCDYTSSGRALQFIEDYILKEVLPFYGNCATTPNVTAVQSDSYRQEAHTLIREAVNASNDDVMVFVGTGCSSALRNLIYALELEEPPVVFVGSSEHNSALSPWHDVGAKVIRIAETKEGFLDLIDLENKLQKERQLLNSIGSRAQFIGCFLAASNVSGILADDIATTILLHQYGAYSFWDYSTAAPYVPLDMNPSLPGNDKGVYKDALFFSGHKFVGGVQSSGVLIAKKKLFDSDEKTSNENVYLACRPHQTRLQDLTKPENGAGAVINAVRMGLAMQLKENAGSPNILAREQKITKTVLSFIRTIPEIILLGNGSETVKRIPVFSFLVRHPRGVFLHHNFVCAVLNDVFGIQARGGLPCAEPYAHDLFGIDEKLSGRYDEELAKVKKVDSDKASGVDVRSELEMLRPGFVRISLPYFMSDSEVAFVLEAVKMVATEGWKLLPQYALTLNTAEWKHRTSPMFREKKCLSSVRYIEGKMSANERKISGQSPFPQDPADCLQMARNVFNKARKMAHRYPVCDQPIMFKENVDELRWFMLPGEAQDLLLGNNQKVKTTVSFTPGEYSGTRNNSVTSENASETIVFPQKNISPLLDVSSMYCRHNSLTSFETNQLKRSSSYLTERACSDCECLSPFRSSLRKDASCRTRCYSLESSSASPPSRFLSNIENGHCSCGSQTDISDADSAKDGQVSTDFSDFGDMGITTLFPASENENLQAYVKGVTEELASEIKTEIREVIATVDNVLSESMENLEFNSLPCTDFRRTCSTPYLANASCPQYSLPNLSDNTSICYTQPMANYGLTNNLVNSVPRNRLSGYDTSRNSIVVADEQRNNVTEHVAEYLAELTSEMVTEMKTELREMVSAVDEIISPSNCDKIATAEISIKHKLTKAAKVKNDWEDSDDSQSHSESTCTDPQTEDVIMEMKSKTVNGEDIKRVMSKSDSSSDSGVAEISSKNLPTKVTKRKISVIAREAKSSPNVKEDIIQSQLNVEFKIEKNENSFPHSSLDKRKRSFENVTLQPKWHCPPKGVWKPTVEGIREYDMIREGDRVLVCLSGGKDSLSLLHTLHQYQYYAQSYGVTFTFGAVTLDSGNSMYDPRPLIPYLHALGVHYLYEEQRSRKNTENDVSIHGILGSLKRNFLYKAAKENNYNVLALGQHFDDVAETFLMSMFHYGKLHSMKAHYYLREHDLRIIRPFIFVREKYLRQFTENRKLPVINENYSIHPETPKEKQRMKQLLAQQEIMQPKLFNNLKSALQPFIGFPLSDEEESKKKKFEDSDSTVFMISDTEEEDDEVEPN